MDRFALKLGQFEVVFEGSNSSERNDRSFCRQANAKNERAFCVSLGIMGGGEFEVPWNAPCITQQFLSYWGIWGEPGIGSPIMPRDASLSDRKCFFFSPGAKTFINGFIFCINIYILYRCIFYDIFVTENKEFYINYDTVMNNMPLIYHFMYISFYIYI